MPVRCPLCAAPAQSLLPRHVGYVQGQHFDVCECSSCDARFAWPMRSDSAVYEAIYAAPEVVPAYRRYKRFQRIAANSKAPLAALAQVEDVYWLLQRALQRHVRPEASVLEIGSGLGYTTHALRAAGYDAQGLDVSAEAVQQATACFGPHFRCGTTEQLVLEKQRFDAIVATELIEHLEDPSRFVAASLDLLQPGGVLILTTPNKDLYPASWVWHTELAPVHLWWFGRASMRYLAWSNEATVSFVEGGPFFWGERPVTPLATKSTTLSERGEVVFRDGPVNALARSLMRWAPRSTRYVGRPFLHLVAQRREREQLHAQGLSLCAVMRRAES